MSDTHHLIAGTRERRDLVAQIHQRREHRAYLGIIRQMRNDPVAQRESIFGGARRLHLDLHPRDIHPGRAFAPAGFAGHAEAQRLAHALGHQCLSSELS